MADKLNIKMASKEGITLHTAGTYFDKDIQIIPDFPIDDGSSSALGLRKLSLAREMTSVGDNTPLDNKATYEQYYCEVEPLTVLGYVCVGVSAMWFDPLAAGGGENYFIIKVEDGGSTGYLTCGIPFAIENGLTEMIANITYYNNETMEQWLLANTDPVDGTCSGEHIIPVIELPTENIDSSAIYKLRTESNLSDVIVYDGEAFSLMERYRQYGFTVQCFTLSTRMEGVDPIDFVAGIMPLYFIEDENDVCIYGDLRGTGTNSWESLGTAFGGEDPLTFGGIISNIGEATNDGCYYAVGGREVVKYYQYRDCEFINMVIFTDAVESIGGYMSGLYYVPTRPTENIQVSDFSNYTYFAYYIEDEMDILFYGGMDGTGTPEWVSASKLWTGETYTFNGAITDVSQATETGYYAVVTEAGFSELIDPTGTLTIISNGEYNVTPYAGINVNVTPTIPTVYWGKTLDDLPTSGVIAGSCGVVTHGDSSLSGVSIPISWKTPGTDYLREGVDVWYKDDKVYYSYYTTQYVLDKENREWKNNTWSGLTSFEGRQVWTDGTNYYFSSGNKQYILDGDTWIEKTWTGLPNFYGEYIWTDETTIYYSNGGQQYVLNKEAATWEQQNWIGLSNIDGRYIWTDGINIYYSFYYYSSSPCLQYILNKKTSTWEPKEWLGSTTISGTSIWTDGINIYSADQYILDGDTWKVKKWAAQEYGGFGGANVWTDGTYYYYSSYSNSYYVSQFLLAPAATTYVFAQGKWREAADLGDAVLATKTIETSAVYNAIDEGVQGYSTVTVRIPEAYETTSLSNIPSNAVEGSIAIIWEVNE